MRSIFSSTYFVTLALLCTLWTQCKAIQRLAPSIVLSTTLPVLSSVPWRLHFWASSNTQGSSQSTLAADCRHLLFLFNAALILGTPFSEAEPMPSPSQTKCGLKTAIRMLHHWLEQKRKLRAREEIDCRALEVPQNSTWVLSCPHQNPTAHVPGRFWTWILHH